MKSKLIIPRKNKPTLINLDILCNRDELEELRTINAGDPTETFFSLVLMNYIKTKAKELHCTPQFNRDYKMFNLMKDGSRIELVPPPPFVHQELLQRFKEQKIINYDLYSDEEQCGLIDVNYKGKNYSLELCVQQSKYGREIVVRKK